MPRRRGDTQVAHSNRSLATAVTINYYFNLAADFEEVPFLVET